MNSVAAARDGAGTAPTTTSLNWFRRLLGVILFSQAIVCWKLFASYYASVPLIFPYIGSVYRWPGWDIRYLLIAMGVSSVGVVFSRTARAASAVYFTAFSLFFLMDKMNYANHFYLIWLLSFLMIFCAPGPGERRGEPPPDWKIFLLQAQFCLVYFFAGLGKLDADWLHGEPLRHTLHGRRIFFLPPFHGEWAAYFFSYAGLVFDLSTGPLLLWKKSRPWVLLPALLFNLINASLFHLGVFPYLMIAGLVLFVDPRWIRRAPTPSAAPAKRSRAATAFVAVYLLVQILVPLRHWLYPGHVSWTEEGHRFSWHLMLRNKRSKVRITALDPSTSLVIEHDVNQDLNARQRANVGQKPDFLFQYAQYLKREQERAGVARPVVMADVMVSLNFRDPKPFIDPNVNLAEAHYPLFGHADWIAPEPPPLP
jgi:vitamin K-dependent gamma-carboxylase